MPAKTKDELIASLDAFTRGYIECALWSSTDGRGAPLNDNYGVDDITISALRGMIADCLAFQTSHAELMAGLDAGQCGHDFWLARNGHAEGFWDRGLWDRALGERGDRLTAASEVCGGVGLTVFRGRIYSSRD